jgi:hypothetical protein
MGGKFGESGERKSYLENIRELNYLAYCAVAGIIIMNWSFILIK